MNEDDIAFAQDIGADFLHLAVFADTAGDRAHARSAQRLRLRLAPAFGHSFSEVGEQNGEPEPDRELRDEAAIHRRREDADGGQCRANHRHKHDGVFDHQARVELFEGVAHGRAGDFPIEQ